jgi:hypothetical protein
VCVADIADRVGIGETRFGRYPENLLNSRARYMRAFEVRPVSSTCICECVGSSQHRGLLHVRGCTAS